VFARGFRETSEVACGNGITKKPGLNAVPLRDSYRRRVLQRYSITPRYRGSEGRETDRGHSDFFGYWYPSYAHAHVAELRGVAYSDIQKPSPLLAVQ